MIFLIVSHFFWGALVIEGYLFSLMLNKDTGQPYFQPDFSEPFFKTTLVV
jgi:hypothetical protein